ncbi:MAG: DUF4838 domain-containing protein [Clostridia bacterium]|nr:DUF4838 domain-containing protein [Clostridia bacterium]
MIKKLTSIFLSALLALGFLVGCTDTNDSSSSSTDVNNNQNTTTVLENSIHEYGMEETNDYLVRNGKSDYTIVLPQASSGDITIARDEFIALFKEATNVSLKVVFEDEVGLTHNATNKYISLGQTKLLESADLKIDYDELTLDGVRIFTKDKTLYLVGGSDWGTVYAVYVFMELMFHFDVYYHNVYELDKDLYNVKLYKFDVKDVPDIPMRNSYFGYIRYNVNNAGYRMRMANAIYAVGDNYFMPLGDTGTPGIPQQYMHNTKEILPVSADYAKGYVDKWYDERQHQWCYTAHGDEEAYEFMVEKIAYNICEYSLKRYTPDLYPYMNFLTVTIEDGAIGICSCDACKKAIETYGSITGAVIKLLNRVMEKVQAWQNLEENAAYRRPNLRMLFFAYWDFLDSPTKYNEETGLYEVTHPDCVMREDVGVWVALSSNGIEYNIDITSDRNTAARNLITSWADITDNFYLWTYQANYDNQLGLDNCFSFFTDKAYKFFAEKGAKYWFNEMRETLNDTTVFKGLRAYLDSKLMWNANLDSEELTDKWFKAMYQAAAPFMKSLFHKEREFMNAYFLEIGSIGSGGNINDNNPLTDGKIFSVSVLKEWISICDEALEFAQETYATHLPETYARVKYNIELESISPLYFLLSLHKGYLTAEEYTEAKTKFQNVLADKNSMPLVDDLLKSLD